MTGADPDTGRTGRRALNWRGRRDRPGPVDTGEDVMNRTAQMISGIATALRGTAYHTVLIPFFPDDPRVRFVHGRGFPFATHGRTDMGSCIPVAISTTRPSRGSWCARWWRVVGVGWHWWPRRAGKAMRLPHGTGLQA